MKKQLFLLLTFFSLSFAFGQDTTTEVIIGSDVPSATINSITNIDALHSKSVLEIFFQDSGGDGLDTKITKIKLTPNTSTNTADWTDNIKGVYVWDSNYIEYYNDTTLPVITDDYIEFTFNAGDLIVPDNNTDGLLLYFDVFLNDSAIQDGKILSFKVDSTNSGFTTDSSGSGLKEPFTNGDIVSNDFTIEVIATKLQILQQPSNVVTQSIMTPDVTVAYTDANNNIDIDNENGTTSSLSVNNSSITGNIAEISPINGIMTFSNLILSQSGYNVSLTITDDYDSPQATITSNIFFVIDPCSQLLISEYGEPSSGYGKYIEIYNPTSQDIVLDNYELWKAINGGGWTASPLALSGTITAYSTYTVANNSTDVPNADDYNTALTFNGNDAMGLAYNGGSGTTFTLIDVIGIPDTDPGTGWDVAGTTNGTQDHTLIRKASVQNPNTDWVSSAGTNATDSEWEVLTYGLDNFGSHSSDCFCSGTTTTWSSSGWSNSAPTIHDMAIIESNYNTSQSGDIEACTLVINSGTLNIELGNYIKVRHSIENNGSIVIDHQGSLVQVENSATVTGTGTYSTTVKTTSMDDARYTYFSSPTQTDTMGIFSSWAATDRMFGWDGTNQVWSAVTTATAMTPGLGYIVRPTTGATFPGSFSTDFQGAFNNGVITTTLYNTNVYSGTDDDNSLVGNPYPSAISTADLLTANTDANAFYFWTHNTGTDWSSEEYAVYSSSGSTGGAPATISTGQGFFVTSTASSDFTFNNDLRVTGNNDTFLRPANNLDKVWLNVIANTNAGSQLLLGFIPDKTDGFDAQYDAKRINSTENSISFSSNGTDTNTANLAIQARNVLSDDDTIIPLNVFVNDSNIQTATISIDHLENLTDRNIFLKDNVLNTLTDLKQGDYQFSVSQTGVINDRFEVLFSRNALGVDNNTVSTDLIVSQKRGFFNLNTSDASGIKSASIYNMLGQVLGNYQATGSNLQIPATNISRGTILIIKTTLDNGSVISKKVIKL